MPEFKQSIAAVNQDFGQVRSSVPTTSKGEILGKGLTAAIPGAVALGKRSAAQSGVEAGREFSGVDLSLEEVNRGVDDINATIQENLGIKQQEVGGELTQRQIAESKDASLRSLSLTSRHIKGLLESGSITSTEANARRRIVLSQKMNEGSNFLFRDEFINAMSDVTGGVSGAATSAYFPKTAEEQQAEMIAQAQADAMAAREETVVGTMLTTGFPREQVERELAQRERDAKFTAEAPINAAHAAQQVDRLQAMQTQDLELRLRSMTVDGALDGEGTVVAREEARSRAEEMRVALSNKEGLMAPARDKRMQDIEAWEQGMYARVEMLSKSAQDKATLANVETIVKLAGVEAYPDLAIISGVNKDVAAALAKIPAGSQEKWKNALTTEKQSGAINRGIKAIAQLLSGNRVGSPEDLGLYTQTEEGLKDATDPNSENKTAWSRMFSDAPAASFVNFRTRMALKNANPLSPGSYAKELRGSIVDHYGFTRDDIARKAQRLETDLPTVKLVNVVGGRTKGIMDIPDELAQYPDVVSTIEQGFKTFKEHAWLWNEVYDNPADGYNAFMRGEHVLTTGLEEPVDGVTKAKPKEAPKQAPAQAPVAAEEAPISTRLNNPGNLRSFGDMPTEETASGTFARFETPEAGTRALARDLSTKISRGDNSIQDIISQYSPDTDPENIKRGHKAEDYIRYVADKTGIPRDRVVSSPADVAKVMRAIIDFESGGGSPITDEQIRQGIKDAERR